MKREKEWLQGKGTKKKAEIVRTNSYICAHHCIINSTWIEREGYVGTNSIAITTAATACEHHELSEQ